MLRVVQYEVHILDEGRWYFHARYPGAERDEALSDARQTEYQTGYPAKVIKDTYHRDLNYSEETVIYLSPNAKSKAPKRKPRGKKPGTYSGKHTGSGQSARQTQNDTADVIPVSNSKFLTRLVLALLGSLIIASGLTVLLGTVLNNLPNFGIALSSDAGNKITIYWYIAMFGVSCIALNKAYVPWRRLFANHAKSSITASRIKAVISKPARGMSFKPKNDSSERERELAKETQDMKVQRGDLDTIDVLNDADSTQDPTEFGSEPVPAKVPEKPAPQVKVEADQSDTQQKADEKKQEQPKPEKKTGLEKDAEIANTKAAAESQAARPDKPTALTDMDLDRLMMVRFLGDTVMNLRTKQAKLDAQTRHGIALYLAGAAAALADRRGLTPQQERDVLLEALTLLGQSNEEQETFMQSSEQQLDMPKNKEIVHAGEEAMYQHLQLSNKPNESLRVAIAKWGQPTERQTPPVDDVFLLSSLPIENALEGADEIERHNKIVRAALAKYNGEEVRHTGKGVFARFNGPEDGLRAAFLIQRTHANDVSVAATIRLALAAGQSTDDGADITGRVFEYLNELCSQIEGGQIAGDARLQNSWDTSTGLSETASGQDIIWKQPPTTKEASVPA
jgi:adenylate cyclase